MMSTAELKNIIDQRSPEERKWMGAYLIDEIFSVPELRQTAEELAELARRRADIIAGHNQVRQQEAEAHWDALDKKAT